MASFNFQLPLLRLGEFDIGGVLYHANYFHVFEMAREAFLATAGLPYPALVEQNRHLPLVEAHQEFLKPVRYGQALEVQLSFSEVKNSSLKVHYEIFSAAELLHRAWTKLVFVDAASGGFKPTRLPDELKAACLRYTPNAPITN